MFTPQTVEVTEVVWNGEGAVEFNFNDGSMWEGAKRKDFWHPDDNWESRIVKGSMIRLWTVQLSNVVGFEYQAKETGEWMSVWCVINDFGTKKERDDMEDDYVHFIEEEGHKIGELIDAGKTLEEIDTLVSGEHSGNTYACALGLGVSLAKNKENADKIRKGHNKKWGVPGTKEGLVNPAVLTINVEDKDE